LLQSLQPQAGGEPRASTGIPGIDRVLGGGLVPATVALLAGEPGISHHFLPDDTQLQWQPTR
jgi:DNA repair protein RadA/Sms